MANASFSTVISLEPKWNRVRFLSSVGRDKSTLQIEQKTYKARQFDPEFFQELTKMLQAYSAAKPSFAGKAAQVTLLVPDDIILTDSINIPTIKRKSMGDMLKVAVTSKYKNLPELKYKQYLAGQNKQYATFMLALIRQSLLQSLYTSCAQSNMFANILTYAGNATVSGALALTPALKNKSFVLADVKETYTRICYVVHGVTVGCYDVPLGFEILSDSKLAAENMFFDHDVAELAVLNAKEKARAKQLTMMGGGEADAAQAVQTETSEGEEELSFTDTPATNGQVVAAQQIKTLPKKTPRMLPKFMQRPTPETPEGFVFENFRLIEKWILEFILGNQRLTSMAAPDCIYINMPPQYDFLFPLINAEEKENGYKMQSLGLGKEKEDLRLNLELFGGLFAGQNNPVNNF